MVGQVGCCLDRGDDLVKPVGVVIGSHGMAITAWMVHDRRIVAPQEAARFWTVLAFPDIVEVD